jgi:hypothetical protein
MPLLYFCRGGKSSFSVLLIICSTHQAFHYGPSHTPVTNMYYTIHGKFKLLRFVNQLSYPPSMALCNKLSRTCAALESHMGKSTSRLVRLRPLLYLFLLNTHQLVNSIKNTLPALNFRSSSLAAPINHDLIIEHASRVLISVRD